MAMAIQCTWISKSTFGLIIVYAFNMMAQNIDGVAFLNNFVTTKNPVCKLLQLHSMKATL